MKTIVLALVITLVQVGYSMEPEEIINEFSKHLVESEFEAAVAELFANAPESSGAKVSALKLTAQLQNMTDGGGPYYGADLIVEQKMGERLVSFVYLARYEKGPIRFQFRFYRPNERWIFQSLHYSDKLEQQFSTAVKENIESLIEVRTEPSGKDNDG